LSIVVALCFIVLLFVCSSLPNLIQSHQDNAK